MDLKIFNGRVRGVYYVRVKFGDLVCHIQYCIVIYFCYLYSIPSISFLFYPFMLLNNYCFIFHFVPFYSRFSVHPNLSHEYKQ